MTTQPSRISILRRSQLASVLVLLIYAAASAWLIMDIRASCGGGFVYSLDDTYIHMAIAENVLEHGTFGVNAGEVAFASSSIMWPWLLAAGYVVLGSIELLPLVLNIVFALMVLWLFDVLLRREGIGVWMRLAAGVVFIFGVPLLPVVFTGLEHTMHIAIVLGVFMLLPAFATGDAGAKQRRLMLVLLFAGVLVRFETLFLAAALMAWFAFRREFMFTTLILAAVALPVAVNGFIQLAYGGFFLPNSLMMKGHLLNVLSPASWYDAYHTRIIGMILRGRAWYIMLVLASLLIALLAAPKELRRRWTPPAAVWLTALLLHLVFANVGWYFRYEAYLMTVGLAMTAVLFGGALREAFSSLKDRRASGGSLVLVSAASLLFFIIPLARHGVIVTQKIPQAARGIYDQQLRMAEFLRAHYNGESVMVNDIGYIGWRGEVRVVDLAGLASTEVACARYDGEFNTEYIRDLARREQVPVAVIYENWFEGDRSPPGEWIPAARWSVDKQYILGGKTVTVFATDSVYLPTLQEALRGER